MDTKSNLFIGLWDSCFPSVSTDAEEGEILFDAPNSVDNVAPDPILKPKKEDNWMAVDYLKLALEIEKTQAQRTVFYVDVAGMTKAKAEEHVRTLQEKATEIFGEIWIPRKEGDKSELIVMPGSVDVSAVIETARKLKKFAEEVD